MNEDGDGEAVPYVAPPPFARPPEPGPSAPPGYLPYPPTYGPSSGPGHATGAAPWSGGYWPGYSQSQAGYPPPDGHGQPYAPPPGYPYAGYPPPGYLLPPPSDVSTRAPATLAFGVVPAALAALGALLVVIALLGLPWYTPDGESLTTGDVRGILDDYGDLASGLSVAYFSWLSWLLLLAAAGSAVAAALPMAGLSLAFRIAGPIISGFAVLLSFGAIELKDSVYTTGEDYGRYFDTLSAGFWTAIVGFVLVGAAAVIGPRRVHIDAR
jgi:hypothetical protein